jgi:cytochrome c-type biogenesis protein CcmH
LRRRLAATAVAVLALLAPAVVAAAPQPRTNLADIEDEVMCTVCGTLLELSDSPQANEERTFIRHRIARGETKDQIKDELVAQFGPRVLALPPASGFDLSAYVVPAVAFVAAVIGVALGLRRWRRGGGGQDGSGSAPLDSAEAKRLDTDMARYDL